MMSKSGHSSSTKITITAAANFTMAKGQSFLLLLLAFSALLTISPKVALADSASFPRKKLTIVVYTAPGGLIDLTARKLASILETTIQTEQGRKVPVIVENKKGAGGLVALNSVLHRPADAHTILGFTSSVVDKLEDAGKLKMLDGLQPLRRVVSDYECLITDPGVLPDFPALTSAAAAGELIWVGPATGGTDHKFAQKVWAEAGLNGKYLPYRSGSEALAALMGGHGQVYVGNPQDVVGRPNLKVIAVASPERLEAFPEAPTFKELGNDSLTGEALWRGLAVREGAKKDDIDALQSLLEKAVGTKDWIDFVNSGNAQVVSETGEQFAAIIKQQTGNHSS